MDTMFYSKLTNGFYSVDVNGKNIPEDAVEISQNDYQNLLIAQASGATIVSGEDGHPIAVSERVSSDQVRLERNRRLRECDWVALKDVQIPSEHLENWFKYRQSLRDITNQHGFPESVIWPKVPE